MFEDDADEKYLANMEKEEHEMESFLEKEKKRQERKELKLFTSDNYQFEKIRKNLYVETREVSKMTDKEIADFRKKNGEIKIRGLQCPKPISNWYQCGLPDNVLRILELKEFHRPFPI